MTIFVRNVVFKFTVIKIKWSSHSTIMKASSWQVVEATRWQIESPQSRISNVRSVPVWKFVSKCSFQPLVQHRDTLTRNTNVAIVANSFFHVPLESQSVWRHFFRRYRDTWNMGTIYTADEWKLRSMRCVSKIYVSSCIAITTTLSTYFSYDPQT